MLVARLACLRSVPLTGLRPVLNQGSPALRSSILKTHSPLLRTQQEISSKARFGFRRSKTQKGIFSDPAVQPLEIGKKFDSFGRMLLIGGSACGMGLMCYYGLGMSDEMGAIEKSMMWPQIVKDRIHSTYMYFAGSVGLTALSAYAVGRTPQLMSLMMRGSWMAIGATFAAMIGAGMLVRSISYEHSPVPKHLAWMLHAGVMGAVIAPLTLLGGPLIMRAALTTAGIVGGLSFTAMCAPSEKFLTMGAPLGVLFGVVFASSIGSMLLPSTSVFASGLYSISVYGGLLLFSFFLLYDTQKVIKRAETHPTYGVQKYDPINACMGIYVDTLNIFVRLMAIMSGGGSRRK
ncbi:growth hormone-inducible transmembrane protein isoform X2 [Halichoeres trimaculatus]|uniref:growth hormone-inducible transmembrane protein isoform X2 n=1 Tax=Halichoeres trimaculatus TaxID=147232 RepID=UPI003D9EFCC7